MIELVPIGHVRYQREDISEIEIDERFVEGLYRLEERSHVLVLFIFHKSDGYELRVHPRGDPRNPLVGVFASRSPRRPNPVGATVVKLVSVNGNIVTVSGLDAWEGSPVIDIKPDRGAGTMVKTNNPGGSPGPP